MNRLCLILIKSCLVLSLVMRAVQTHPAEGETVTGSDMSKTTLAPKAELISSTNPSLHTELITTQSKPLIPASTGVPPSIPTAGFRFHAGSFVGGMALAIIITLAVALGYRLACSQREVRYRAIHKAPVPSDQLDVAVVTRVRNMMPSFKMEPLRKYRPKHMLVMI